MMVGGMALLFLRGYDVFNQDVWSYSLIIARDDPWSLLYASMKGEDANLYRGISFAFGGISSILTSAFLIVMSSMLGSIRSFAVGRFTFNKGAVKKEKVRSITRLNLAPLKERIDGVFKRDPLVELESDSGAFQKVVSIGEGRVTKRVKVKRPLRHELSEVFSEGMGKARSLLFYDVAAKEAPALKESVRSNKSGEFESLNKWFRDAQRGSEDVGDLVSRANEICEGMEDKDFSEFAAKDPINGAFIVRLVKSWADRNSAELEGQENEVVTPVENESGSDQEVMQAAVMAMKNGENFSVDGEREVDLNEEEAMEYSIETEGDVIADDGMEAMMKEAAAGMDFSDEDEIPEEIDSTIYGTETEVESIPENGSGTGIDVAEGADRETEEIVNIISEMRSFVLLSNAVSSGDDEWPEALASEEQRKKHITSTSSTFVNMGMILGEDVLDLAERMKDDFDEFEWLIENRKIAEDGFVKFIESITFSDMEGSDNNPEPSNVNVERVPGDIDSQEDELGEGEKISGDVSNDESVSLTDESSMENAVSNLQSDHPDAEENSEDIAGVAKREPVDLSIPELSEVTQARSLPIIWGKTCREAGATEASVAKFVFEKVDDTLEQVGVAHLVAGWKNHYTSTRLNVIFKKVPEGDWSLRLAGSVRMERGDGDFVEVSEKFLNYKEIKNSKTIIHFYGEGVEDFEPVRMGDNVMVISKILSVEEIRDFIKS
jgi:hypothetical protein